MHIIKCRPKGRPCYSAFWDKFNLNNNFIDAVSARDLQLASLVSLCNRKVLYRLSLPRICLRHLFCVLQILMRSPSLQFKKKMLPNSKKGNTIFLYIITAILFATAVLFANMTLDDITTLYVINVDQIQYGAEYRPLWDTVRY